MNVEGLIILAALIGLGAGLWLGRTSKRGEITQLKNSISHHEYQQSQFKEKVEAAFQKQHAAQSEQDARLRQREATLEKFKSEVATLQRRNRDLMEANSKLHEIHSGVLETLRSEGALLPSAVRWADFLQGQLDQAIVTRLETPPHPAPAAASKVREAREHMRQWKQEAEVLRNRVELYESQAPWLLEFAEYSLDEIISGLREERDLGRVYEAGDDPVGLFLAGSELGLSTTDRNQLALDRYWQHSRKRSAWIAGIQYERYVGYLYELEGFAVEYHGALRGKEDLGIDLVCRSAKGLRLIQCKRLSRVKGIPVRENVVAQIYGAAMFFAMREGISPATVRPVLVTTFELSSEARQFADLLGVSARENVSLEQYPCIKCNVSGRTGERIYHLPFDQQYDSVRIGNAEGEFYAMTVREAESKMFRRAFRWRGPSS